MLGGPIMPGNLPGESTGNLNGPPSDMAQALTRIKHAAQAMHPGILNNGMLKQKLALLQQKASMSLQNGQGAVGQADDPESRQAKLQLMQSMPQMMENILAKVTESTKDGAGKLPMMGISPSVALYAGLQCKQMAAEDVDNLITMMGANASFTGNGGASCLHWACWHKRGDIVDVLLKHKASVHQLTGQGQTPLLWAAASGSLGVLKSLIKAGADPQFVCGSTGKNAFLIACENGHIFFADYLRHFHDADPTHVDRMGRNALHWASFGGAEFTVSALIAMGLDPRTTDSEANGALHLACEKDQRKVVLTIFRCGDPIKNLSMLNQRNSEGLTPIDVCKEYSGQDFTPNIPGALKMKKRKGFRTLGVLDSLAKHATGRKRTFHEKTGGRFVLPGVGRAAFTIQCMFWGMQSFGILFILTIFMPTFPSMMPLFLIDIVLALLACVCMRGIWHSDPGYINSDGERKDRKPLIPGLSKRKNREGYEHVVQVEHEGLMEIGEQTAIAAKGREYGYLGDEYKRRLLLADTERLCATCQVWKPNRAKHDQQSNRCIAKFDHFCPWVNAPIGLENYRLFLSFTMTEMLTMGIFFPFACVYLHRNLFSGPTFGALLLLPYTTLCAMLLVYSIGFNINHSKFVCFNFTTNEHINWRRYPYMSWGHRRKLETKYDQGNWKNVRNFCTNTYNEKHFFKDQDKSGPGIEDNKANPSKSDRSFFMMSLLYPQNDLRVNQTQFAGPEALRARLDHPDPQNACSRGQCPDDHAAARPPDIRVTGHGTVREPGAAEVGSSSLLRSPKRSGGMSEPRPGGATILTVKDRQNDRFLATLDDPLQPSSGSSSSSGESESE